LNPDLVDPYKRKYATWAEMEQVDGGGAAALKIGDQRAFDLFVEKRRYVSSIQSFSSIFEDDDHQISDSKSKTSVDVSVKEISSDKTLPLTRYKEFIEYQHNTTQTANVLGVHTSKRLSVNLNVVLYMAGLIGQKRLQVKRLQNQNFATKYGKRKRSERKRSERQVWLNRTNWDGKPDVKKSKMILPLILH
jgi:hypothetical protein